MTEDFIVVIETGGTRQAYTPEAFRLICASAALSLDECVRAYNVRMLHEGLAERARMLLRKTENPS